MFFAVIGPSGAGKSSCCEYASDQLDCGFVDLDQLIRCGAGVRRLNAFRTFLRKIDEARFFDIAVMLCKAARLAADQRDVLVAVGGGVLNYAKLDLPAVRGWLESSFDRIITVADAPQNAHARRPHERTLEQYCADELSTEHAELYGMGTIHEVAGRDEQTSRDAFVGLLRQLGLRGRPDPPTRNLDERRREAVETCEVVEHTLIMLLNDRQTYARFRDGAMRSPAVLQTHFPLTAARWYSESVLVALRRLGDRDKRSHSLRRLFDRMAAHRSDWDFEAVVELWDQTTHRYDPSTLELLASGTYEWIADHSGRRLNVDRVLADRAMLDSILEKVRVVVDKTIAHSERGVGAPAKMTWAQLDEAIFDCEELAKRYIALLTGRGYSLQRGSMTPIEQTPWYRIFEPWEDLDVNTFRPAREPGDPTDGR